MKFSIVIQLSNKEIAFYYCRQGSDGRLRPFDGEWPAPLAIYCHGTELEIGDAALTAANQQVAGAYTNIFKVATQSGYFDFNGIPNPLNKLLLHAIEFYLKRFLKETLMQSAGTLDDLRGNMSLNFIFNVNLKKNQTEYVIDLFRNNGYKNVCELDYNKYILQRLDSENPSKMCTVFSSDENDLYFRCYSAGWASELIKLRGLGQDQRLTKAMESIISDINDFDPYIGISQKELNRIYIAAKNFLDYGELTISDYITLDDQRKVPFYLALTALGTSGEACELLRRSVKSEFEKLGLESKHSSLVLKGRDICNSYFRDSLRPMFGQCFEVSGDTQNEVFNLIASDLLSRTEPPLPLTHPNPPVEPIKQPDEFMDKVKKIDSKKLNRQWREVSASAQGEARKGLFENAFRRIDDFERSCHNMNVHIIDGEIINLRTEINKQRDQLTIETPIQRRNSLKSVKKEPEIAEQRKSEETDEGKSLLAKGLVKEARDYYQKRGNQNKVKQLKEIIRNRKLITPWFEEITKTSVKPKSERLNEILSDLDNFIKLCNYAEVPCQDVKELKKYYKNIK